METSGFEAALEGVLREWNRAELIIKTAEQICGEPVMPSVQELRYAGRRLIESQARLASGRPDGVDMLLNDALIDCYRAQHDAIDTAIALVAADLKSISEAVGYEVVLKAYPEFATLNARVIKVSRKIRRSRGDRESRAVLYESIQTDDLPDLAEAYETFRASKVLMEQLAAKERAHRQALQDESARARRLGRVGLAVGAAGVLIAVLALLRDLFNMQVG